MVLVNSSTIHLSWLTNYSGIILKASFPFVTLLTQLCFNPVSLPQIQIYLKCGLIDFFSVMARLSYIVPKKPCISAQMEKTASVLQNKKK